MERPKGGVLVEIPRPWTHAGYCPKYPVISTTRWLGLVKNALIHPLVAGTIAIFDVIAPSAALRLATNGCVVPRGHNVRYPRMPTGTTVTLSPSAGAAAGSEERLAGELG